jgi:MraZ protein
MLMGKFQHNIDVKGRLAMPSKLRESLGVKFILTKGLDGCIFVYAQDEWNNLVEKLKKLTMVKKSARSVARYFFSSASEVECDKQGRILIPPSLRSHAKLEKSTIIVGVGTRAEIWSETSWNKCTDEIDEDVTSMIEELFDDGLEL